MSVPAWYTKSWHTSAIPGQILWLGVAPGTILKHNSSSLRLFLDSVDDGWQRMHAWRICHLGL